MVRTVDLQFADLHIHADGLMHFDYRQGLTVDLQAAQSIIRGARDALDEIRPLPTVVDITGVTGLTREARHYLSTSPENMDIASRVAMIAGNPVSRVVGNFFLGLNRPPIPVKLFGAFADARAWVMA